MAGIILLQGVNSDAQNKIWQAYYTHSQCEEFVNNRLSHFDSMIPKEVKEKLGAVGYIAKSVIDQRVSFAWTFP